MENNYVYDKSMIAALEKFSKSLEFLNKTYRSENVLSSLSRSFQAFKDANEKAIKRMWNMNAIQENLRFSLSNVVGDWEKAVSNLDNLSTSIEKIFKNLNFEELGNSYAVEEEKCSITIEEEHEIREDIVNIISSTLDEKTLEDCKEKWHKKHPVIFAIILIILELILGQLSDAITNATTKKDSNVYIDANSKSSIIINIPENTPVTVIDSSVSYYYKIIYTDTEENKDIEGYIPKRNAVIDN